jgi:hypothetical protein
VNIVLRRGDSRLITVDVYLANVAYPLTGLFVWFTASSAGNNILKTTSLGIVIESSPTNRATITINPGDTSAFPNRNVHMLYDVQVKANDGAIYTVAAGKLVVIPDQSTAIS